MEPWMIVTALVVLVLPFVLMASFQGRDVVDGRGRRVSHNWRVGSKKM